MSTTLPNKKTPQIVRIALVQARIVLLRVGANEARAEAAPGSRFIGKTYGRNGKRQPRFPKGLQINTYG